MVEVTWDDDARFVNWLSNGQGAAGTENGVYDMSKAFPTRAPNASVFLPSLNEWYKAAYYDSTLNGGAGGYWKYATRSNTAPAGDAPPGGNNSANYFADHGYALTQSTSFRPTQDYLTDVGACVNSPSYYGTFDQTGNVEQWNDDLITSQYRPVRGGLWQATAEIVSSDFNAVSDPYNFTNGLGFRVASIPEPASAALLFPLAALIASRRRARP